MVRPQVPPAQPRLPPPQPEVELDGPLEAGLLHPGDGHDVQAEVHPGAGEGRQVGQVAGRGGQLHHAAVRLVALVAAVGPPVAHAGHGHARAVTARELVVIAAAEISEVI